MIRQIRRRRIPEPSSIVLVRAPSRDFLSRLLSRLTLFSFAATPSACSSSDKSAPSSSSEEELAAFFAVLFFLVVCTVIFRFLDSSFRLDDATIVVVELILATGDTLAADDEVELDELDEPDELDD